MQLTVNANGSYNLGDSGVASVTRKVIQFQGAGWTGNISISKRKTTQQNPTQTQLNPQPISYVAESLNGAASDGQPGHTAPITTDSFIQADSTGGEIFAVVTGYAAGSMTIEYSDVVG